MRGQTGSGLPKKRKIAKKEAKDLDKTEKLVLIQTGGGKSSHSFDASYGQTDLVHIGSTKTPKQIPVQKLLHPKIIKLRAKSPKQSNTIPSQKLVSTYL